MNFYIYKNNKEVRITLHPKIRVYRGQEHGFGLYFPWNHSPEMVAKTFPDALAYAQAMLD